MIRNNTHCSVPQCKSRGTKNPELSFHNFPRSSNDSFFDRRQQWIVALRIGKPVTDRMKVCSKHFTLNDYFTHANERRRGRLKAYAVPSQCLPVPLTDIPEKVTKKMKTSTKRPAQNQIISSSIKKHSSEPVSRQSLPVTENISWPVSMKSSSVTLVSENEPESESGSEIEPVPEKRTHDVACQTKEDIHIILLDRINELEKKVKFLEEKINVK